VLTGRRTFDVAQGWGQEITRGGPAFVVTHHIPAGWPRPNSTVHFVTDGVESAVIQAKVAARKSVGAHGAHTIDQCLNAGLPECPGPNRRDFLHLTAAAYRTAFHSAEAARADRKESDLAVVSHTVSYHQSISRAQGRR
jgi:hypothetical protein